MRRFKSARRDHGRDAAFSDARRLSVGVCCECDTVERETKQPPHFWAHKGAQRHAMIFLPSLQRIPVWTLERITGIVRRLQQEEIKPCRDAAVSLANIVHDSQDIRSTILYAGGVAALVALLRKQLVAEVMQEGVISVESYEAMLYSIKTLNGLCLGGHPWSHAQAMADVQRQIALEGGIPLIAKRLRTYEGSEAETDPAQQQMFAECAAAVALWCEGVADSRAKMVEAGAVRPLVNMLTLPLMHGSMHFDVPAYAAAALAALSDDTRIARLLVYAVSAIPPLIILLGLGSGRASESAAVALHRILANNEHAKEHVLKANGIDALVGVLISGATSKARKSAGRALVHAAQGYPVGHAYITERLKALLFSCNPAIDYTVPGHPALLRRRLTAPTHALGLAATLASIPLEPLRIRCLYELTPLPEGEDEIEEQYTA